jgi:hypothetical protein
MVRVDEKPGSLLCANAWRTYRGLIGPVLSRSNGVIVHFFGHLPPFCYVAVKDSRKEREKQQPPEREDSKRGTRERQGAIENDGRPLF